MSGKDGGFLAAAGNCLAFVLHCTIWCIVGGCTIEGFNDVPKLV